MNQTVTMNSTAFSGVEVFKTNVPGAGQAQLLVKALLEDFPGLEINFDLEDCDRILRVAGRDINAKAILSLLKNYGLEASVLEDAPGF